ncbi:MAG: hypothetical protein L7S63_08985 [Flavobacteriales bacterium]|nr:hypothetical protein [Flavobacteriales bacterium]
MRSVRPSHVLFSPGGGESIRKEDIVYLFRIDRAMLEVLEENMDEGFDMENIDEEALGED